jgi:hypothetical protein
MKAMGLIVLRLPSGSCKRSGGKERFAEEAPPLSARGGCSHRHTKPCDILVSVGKEEFGSLGHVAHTLAEVLLCRHAAWPLREEEIDPKPGVEAKAIRIWLSLCA